MCKRIFVARSDSTRHSSTTTADPPHRDGFEIHTWYQPPHCAHETPSQQHIHCTRTHMNSKICRYRMSRARDCHASRCCLQKFRIHAYVDETCRSLFISVYACLKRLSLPSRVVSLQLSSRLVWSLFVLHLVRCLFRVIATCSGGVFPCVYCDGSLDTCDAVANAPPGHATRVATAKEMRPSASGSDRVTELEGEKTRQAGRGRQPSSTPHTNTCAHDRLHGTQAFF